MPPPILLLLPPSAAGPAPADSDFAAAAKAKLLAAMKRAQEEDGKLPEDMQKLMTANGTCIITNFQPPAQGKKNGGKVCRSTQVKRTWPSVLVSEHVMTLCLVAGRLHHLR